MSTNLLPNYDIYEAFCADLTAIAGGLVNNLVHKEKERLWNNVID